ncbi:MAG: MaoC/PaaZ C-terminal domain-containing protein [Anaeromyxobacter sp.]
MGTSLVFRTSPPTWRAYAAALLSRRPALVPAGQTVPRLEARLDGAVAGAVPLAEFRRLCGCADDGALPITFPHLLANPLHLAMLASPGFPVRLLGVVHVQHRIERRAALPAAAPLDLRCWLEGHRETARGQVFELETEALLAGEVAWRETTTFLARRPAPAGQGPRGAAAEPLFPARARSEVIAAPADLGRRYAAVSGDHNPIHLWPLTARLFGFRRPIAHGLWSLARIAASLEDARGAPATALEASFKLPVLLPAEVQLRAWDEGERTAFVLADGAGVRPHVTGQLTFAPLR